MGGGRGGASGEGVGRWAAAAAALAPPRGTSGGGPMRDSSTGRRTRPFSIPRTVRMASTAKKYLERARRGRGLVWTAGRTRSCKAGIHRVVYVQATFTDGEGGGRNIFK